MVSRDDPQGYDWMEPDLTAADALWAIYPDYLRMGGKPLTEEIAQSTLSARISTLEAKLVEARKEVWHLGLAVGQIAKWPRRYFNRFYIEEWAIRTADLFKRWGEIERAHDILRVTSSNTKRNKRLEQHDATLETEEAG